MDLLRILHMYTTWNWISLVTFVGLGLTWMHPYLRWNSLLILIGVLVSVVVTGTHPFAAVIRNVTGWSFSDGMAWLLDGVVHLIPVVWLGLPTSGDGFLPAMTGLAIWYALVRSRVREIYTKILTQEQYDRITQIVLMLGIMIYAVIRKVQVTG